MIGASEVSEVTRDTRLSQWAAHVIVASTRAAAGVYPDQVGPRIGNWLRERGWQVTITVVPDGDQVGQQIEAALGSAHPVQLVVTAGGTGIHPTDVTPEQTRPFLDQLLPGLMERFRAVSAEHKPTAMLSRGLAGIHAGRAILVNLPGNPEAAGTGLSVLEDVLDHALHQLSGGDHEHAEGAHPFTPDQEQAPVELTRVPYADVCDETLDTLRCQLLSDLVMRQHSGALVTFSGVVRDHDQNRNVIRLDYSAHPNAGALLRQLADEIAQRYGATVAVQHATGSLRVGQTAVFIAVAAGHRREAFEACSELIDLLKQRIPIWKHQWYADGETEWLGL